jgi:hypothetical protein
MMATSLSLSGCGLGLPSWVPSPLRPPLVRLFGFSDPIVDAAKAVSSDEIDQRLPPNSVGVNLQILKEMYNVIFMRVPTGPAEYGGLLNSLAQGASFEGVYNGLMVSTEYRRLEAESRPAVPKTIRVFAEELTRLQMELPKDLRTPITVELSKPLGGVVELPEGGVDPSPDVPAFAEAPPSPGPSLDTVAESAALMDQIESAFLETNLFTMKRVLGTEVFKVIAAKKATRHVLAAWFGLWSARMAGRGVDFQYEQRNGTDPDGYAEWAFGASTDRIQWEVLFRLHRVLNESEGKR